MGDTILPHTALLCTIAKTCNAGGRPRKLLTRVTSRRLIISTGFFTGMKQGKLCLISRNIDEQTVENRSRRHHEVAKCPEHRMVDFRASPIPEWEFSLYEMNE